MTPGARIVANYDTRLYFGNLRYSVNEEHIVQLLANEGIQPHGIDLVRDSSGRSLGYAFLSLSEKEAMRAMELLNGKDFKGRLLRVERAGNSGIKAG